MSPQQSPPAHPFRFALIGAGRVGTAVASLLRRAGHGSSGVASRSAASAEAAAAGLETEVFDYRETLPEVEVVLIGAGDTSIAEIAEVIAPRVSPGTVGIHFAGSLGIEPLRPVVASGGAACALHPVQACPSVELAIARLPGSSWGVTCSDGMEDWAAALVRGELQGVPFAVAEEDRPIWHAASVTTSNGIAALTTAGEALLRDIGYERPIDVLGPLASGTVANAREGEGAGATLTGPIVRGDTATIARHLEALKSRPPELLDAYVAAARAILYAASGAGRIDRDVADTVSAMLEAG